MLLFEWQQADNKVALIKGQREELENSLKGFVEEIKSMMRTNQAAMPTTVLAVVSQVITSMSSQYPDLAQYDTIMSLIAALVYEPLLSQILKDNTQLEFSEDDVIQLRLDVAAPNKVIPGRVFDLAATVRLASSAILNEPNLKRIRSGEVQISRFEFNPYVRLRIEVNAPDCQIYGDSSYSFRMFLRHNSTIFYFQLMTEKKGLISIVVNLYQEFESLGSTRVQTISQEEVIGHVKMNLVSQKMIPKDIAPKDFADPDNLVLQQVNYLSRRLKKLREIKALKGIDTEPHYLIEIEDIEKEIIELQQRI